MNPRRTDKKNEPKSAKDRDRAVQKIEAKTGDARGNGYDISVGEALQAALRENA